MTLGVVILGHEPGYYGTVNPTVATKIDPSNLINDKGQPAREVYLSVEEYPIRVRFDGGDASNSEGHLYLAGEKLTLKGTEAISNMSISDTLYGASTVRITILF